MLHIRFAWPQLKRASPPKIFCIGTNFNYTSYSLFSSTSAAKRSSITVCCQLLQMQFLFSSTSAELQDLSAKCRACHCWDYRSVLQFIQQININHSTLLDFIPQHTRRVSCTTSVIFFPIHRYQKPQSLNTFSLLETKLLLSHRYIKVHSITYGVQIKTLSLEQADW